MAPEFPLNVSPSPISGHTQQPCPASGSFSTAHLKGAGLSSLSPGPRPFDSAVSPAQKRPGLTWCPQPQPRPPSQVASCGKQVAACLSVWVGDRLPRSAACRRLTSHGWGWGVEERKGVLTWKLWCLKTQ